MNEKEITLNEVNKGDEIFYKISNVEKMRPFFMTIVSDSNHWMFVASNGGISAGRKNSEYALFPYYTDDKITESTETTGSKTIVRVFDNGEQHTWEPFSIRSERAFNCQRNLYKSRYGNKLIFEEINHDLALTFQYEWNSSNQFGFVRKAAIFNHSVNEVQVTLIDGLQNVLPYGIGSDLQNSTSNLADAYKRSELLADTGLGIFALSAIIVDKAEPSEALKANTIWSVGLPYPLYLLSSLQLQQFRNGGKVQQEEDVKGMKGAYFIGSEFKLAPNEEKNWFIVANVNQSQSGIIQLADSIKNNKELIHDVLADVEKGTKNLEALAAAADGLQYSSDVLSNTRHFANVLFNIMRGGIFDENYSVAKTDFIKYFKTASIKVFEKNQQLVFELPSQFSYFMLKEIAGKSGDVDFIRLAIEYLPLKFSRRHGDPSRPWNKFSINTRSEIDGSKILDYQGNWRDIFQNWEALAHSYPAFIEGMIYKFLNASTFDGYNPYRVTKDGFDWETIEPDNPWSYIGYWGDHQIIYLLKFLEFSQTHYPQQLSHLLNKEYFVYANVPYKIKSYKEILSNPKDTIAFNHTSDVAIRKKIQQLGADGALLTNQQETIHYVSFTEKVLATLLAKLTNLVPDGGIWMNTQRPEWNDANNALVGNGISMVTLYYIRRFLVFIKPLFNSSNNTEFLISAEMHSYFSSVIAIFEKHTSSLATTLNNKEKKKMLDELGEASSTFRTEIYANHFSGKKNNITQNSITTFFENALAFIDSSIQNNKREDGLYHTYNLLSYDNSQLEISHLSEMLEGQVAVLSSGYLSPEDSLHLLDALKQSALYRPDQNSYILYPNKELPSFLQKNNVPVADVQKIPLLQQLLKEAAAGIIEQDVHGAVHFNGNFKNANDLEAALQNLDSRYQSLVKQDRTAILALFEQVFNHKAFTGRSGTFYGYEGLGSIYWHMVSKLLLAAEEAFNKAIEQKADKEIINGLANHFHDIKEGIGVHKPPQVYGAFSTDPYSHTPFSKGAQQPGMTGQVKEDILTRMGELGVKMKDGRLVFEPYLLNKKEFLQNETLATFVLIDGSTKTIQLEKDSLSFTVCQVPVIYKKAESGSIEVYYKNGSNEKLNTTVLSNEITNKIIHRTDEIEQVMVHVNEKNLR
jgi:hypothetical protein